MGNIKDNKGTQRNIKGNKGNVQRISWKYTLSWEISVTGNVSGWELWCWKLWRLEILEVVNFSG